MSKLPISFVLIIFSLFTFACSSDTSTASKNSDSNNTKIFEALSASASGVEFTNILTEDSVINYFTYPYLYMGGGVAIGDVNNDGFQDVFLTGNMVENKLYLNKGKQGSPEFEDITEKAKVAGDNRWMTGVTMADVNADGWMDIYVSVSGKFATKKNLLYLNDGRLNDGIPSFTESAEQRGIADEGSSTQGTFFDYDKDGDLDLYVANYPYTSFKTPNYSYKVSIDLKNPEKSDKLYQNDGKGFFQDVTAEAGLLNFGLSLSATVGDYNQDGWEDIYVSNDFATPDYFYLNNGDGTFSEKLKEATNHSAYFGMGTDAGDFNNDGLLDILQMDMTPEDNRRNKANMASMNIPAFWEIVSLGMHYQYMQNVFQMNNGVTDDGLPHFSDIARMTGMSSTDWSWAGLLADLDNDGWKDVFITNGTRRDINNKDYFNSIEKATYQERQKFNNLELSQNIPFEKVDNYAYKNHGDLNFEPMIRDWGLSFEGFSNGAAYADLDNDGDLDLVVNNIDEPASVFKNMTTDQSLGNYLRVQFKGPALNPNGLGSKVTIETEKGMQYQELTLSRGFQSSVEPVLHFGLGNADLVQKVTVQWPDGKSQTLDLVKANQVLTLEHNDAVDNNSPESDTAPKYFADLTDELGLDFSHKENIFDDYKHEVLLPHMYSRMGPGLATGDINNDQLEDFFIGGAIGQSGGLYTQQADGTFQLVSNEAFESDKDKEDMGAVFFDADLDGDLDLYVSSGGNEYPASNQNLQDRFYLNDGKGNFSKADVLPDMLASGSRVKQADFDNDGDMDLFVGGRIVARSYPLPAKSTILKNEFKESGSLKFTDVTTSLAPELEEAGLVTDAVWTDFDQDELIDLVIVGEWMPLTFLKNTGQAFENKTEEFGLESSTGWWYSIIAEDFDQDGDIDFAAGNLGLNYKYQASEFESFDVYANDYDRNGKLDIVLGYYNDGVQYPVRGKQCSSEQIPTIKYKYKDYNTFASATLEDIYTEQDLEASLHYQAFTFASSYIENKGNGEFDIQKLPNLSQISSINDFIAEDVNQDGHLDLILAGNLYTSEVETTRNDAGHGLLLIGNGKGDFEPVPFSQSGLLLNADVKDLALMSTKKGSIILAAANNDKIIAYQILPKPGI